METEKLLNLIKNSKKTVIFTGAGVSTASGLQDFRSSDGIYAEKWLYPPEEILSHDFFMNNTEYFYKFYRQKLNSLNYKPNIIHETMKKMQDKNLLSSVITQNIDGFDKLVGLNTLELHGSIYRNFCLDCGKKHSAEEVFNSYDLPRCSCGGLIKPDVVLYQEGLDDEIVRKTIEEISTAKLLIVCGTSLAVYPAASFINFFKGENLVLINKSSTPYDNLANIVIHDDLKNVFQKINDSL